VSTPEGNGASANATEVYWWVDSQRGKLRSVFVPADPALPILEKGLVIEEHANFEWKQAVARWKWSEEGGGGVPWLSCTPLGCCKVG
jgi:hypothetical protein